jgi:hypothetical protein
MNRLYQNTRAFLFIFSCNNPNGICKTNSKTCNIFIEIFNGVIIISLIILGYLSLVGLGLLSSFILNNRSYDISSGCPLNQLNCSRSQLFCSARDNVSIFVGCMLTGGLSAVIICLSLMIVIPIIFGIITILNEINNSYKKTKESMTIAELSEKHQFDIKLDENYQSFKNTELSENQSTIEFDDIEKINLAVQS